MTTSQCVTVQVLCPMSFDIAVLVVNVLTFEVNRLASELILFEKAARRLLDNSGKVIDRGNLKYLKILGTSFHNIEASDHRMVRECRS